MSKQLFFFPFLFSGSFCFVDAFIVCIVSGRWNQSSSALFKCVFRVVVTMHQCYFQCWQFLFLLFFLTHTVRLHQLCDIKPNVSSRVFLFSGPFVEVLASTSRRVQSILQRGHHLSRLSFWWDVYDIQGETIKWSS